MFNANYCSYFLLLMLYDMNQNQKQQTSTNQVLKAALGGGIPGMCAMAIQVTTLMWLRTTMNYQYRYGTSMTEAMRTLYKQGGIPRFYTGYTAALIQGPLSRFGDTAANMGVLELLNTNEKTKDLPIAAKTAAASSAAALFRIILMPVDTVKTMLQIEGARGWGLLGQKIRTGGPQVMFHGSVASSVATWAGHYPWYTTYNYLNTIIPNYKENLLAHLSRSAAIGFTASMISDTVSNSFRVIKTARQAAPSSVSYGRVIKDIVKKDGVSGLMGRGLKTRLLTNGIQGLMFSVFWRLGQDYYAKYSKHDDNNKKEL